MLVQISDNSQRRELSWRKVMHAVWRNFDGLEDLGDEKRSNPIRVFEQRLSDYMDKNLVCLMSSYKIPNKFQPRLTFKSVIRAGCCLDEMLIGMSLTLVFIRDIQKSLQMA